MIYRLLDRLFPRSFTRKILFVAFIGTHIPLLAFTVFVRLGDGPWSGDKTGALLLILGATVAGTGLTLVLLRRLLAPVYEVTRALAAFEERREFAPLPDRHRDEVGFLMAATNRVLTEAQQRIHRYRSEAETDPLTTLLNRRGLMRALEGVEQGSILVLDIDDFKAINDTHGHPIGDAVLQAVARRITTAVREKDIVARLGGEEFVVVINDPRTDPEDVAERLLTSIGSTPVAGIAVTASIGVADYRGDAQQALINADMRTYAAKRQGKNRYCIGT